MKQSSTPTTRRRKSPSPASKPKTIKRRKNSVRVSAPKSPPRWRWFSWAGLFAGLILIALALVNWQIRASWATFTTQADIDFGQLKELYRRSQGQKLLSTNGQTIVLILGVDTLTYRDSLPLTDTIMLLNLDQNQHRLTLLPIPRDLTLPSGEKINSLYANFLTSHKDQAATATATLISDTFALPIHYHLVVSLSQVQDFLTLIGGVTVDIKTGFTDPLYPRDDVDIRVVTNPLELYETVSFTAGLTDLTPEQALKFMRSRHAPGSEGNDYARSARQQQILSAVGQKVGQRLLQDLSHYDLTFLGQLYQFYQQHFAAQIPFDHVLALGHYLLAQGNLPQVEGQQLGVAPGDPEAVIKEQQTKQQWYLSVTDWAKLKQEVQTKLQLSGI